MFLFTNMFKSINKYPILLLNIYIKYEYFSLWFGLPGKFFNLKIYKSQEKEMMRKKRDIFFKKVFVNNLQILPI